MKILHTGDWHIGDFRGPEKNGENLRLKDIINCLNTLVSKARQEIPDVIIIAGDIFHQAKVWSDRGLAENQTAVNILRKLSTIAPVIAMRGTPNHDAEEQFKSMASTFQNTNVHIITEPCVKTYITYKNQYIQIACLPGFDRNYYRTKNPGIDKETENSIFTEAIKNTIVDMKKQMNPAIPSILVSHFTIIGADMESGQTAFFEKIEPVVYPETLAMANYDLTCFGHIHKPQQVCPQIVNNVFYCGAVSALNFNDEGQPRGFYIHDINDTTRVVTSRFIELPTRQFCTIDLEQDDIENINQNGQEYLAPKLPIMQNKIVRIRYNCTDEANKAFNHAALEKYLYQNGIFWVQEITPQNITVTVNRTCLSNDNTPESNLTEYLIDKQTPMDQITAIIDEARPIISEATATKTTTGNNGLFTPVEIEVKNYRNYPEEIFSFEPIQCCTINGVNGAGKSSLFMDAMLDALFEEPREQELTGWISNNKNAKSGNIKFTFDIGDKRYRITRTRTKSGKATLNIAELVNGQWENRSKERCKDTQKEIDNIIGIDSLTLKSCGLVMQDQYGLFLQADKESRMTVLSNILGLNEYETMQKIASDKATEANRAIKSLKEKSDIISNEMPCTEDLRRNIMATEMKKQNINNQITQDTNTADSLKTIINQQKDIRKNADKIKQTIEDTLVKKQLKESTKSEQTQIIVSANTVIAQANEIKNGIDLYNKLTAQEKQLLIRKTEHESLKSSREHIQENITNAETSIKMFEKDNNQSSAQLDMYMSIVNNEPTLSQRHTEYTNAQTHLQELQVKTNDLPVIQTELSTLKQQLTNMDNKYAAESAKLQTYLTELQNKANLLKQSNCPNLQNATCVFLQDAMTAKAGIPTAQQNIANNDKMYNEASAPIRETIKTKEKQLSNLEFVTQKIIETQNTITALLTDEQIYQQIPTAKQMVHKLQTNIQNNQTQIDEKRKFIDEQNAKLAETDRKIAETQACITLYDNIQNDIQTAKRWLDKEKELLTAHEKKTTAENRINELTAEINDIQTELTKQQNELAEITKTQQDTTAVQTQLDNLEMKICNEKEDLQAAIMQIGSLQKQLDDNIEKEKQMTEINKQIVELSSKTAIYEELKKAFSQSGIPHNIIRSIIPMLESTATNILGQMSGGNMSIEFVTEKTLKSNSKKEIVTLDIIINDTTTGRLPYMSRSGGERVKASLSTILALAEIKSRTAGIQLGFLFIDEPPFLDAAGVQAYCDALDTIQKRYNNIKIMAITHDPSMKNRFPQSVEVIKTAKGSKII